MICSPWEEKEKLQLTCRPCLGSIPVLQPTNCPWGQNSCPETCPHGLAQWEVVQPLRHGHWILLRTLIIQDFLCYTPRIPGCYRTRQGRITCRARKVGTHPGLDTRSLHLNANSPCPNLSKTRTAGHTRLLEIWRVQLRSWMGNFNWFYLFFKTEPV